MKNLLPFALLVGTGCAGLNPQLIQASVQKPSNVAVYFAVDTRSGEPVPGLTAEQFRIYEDDKLISAYESKQTILNPEVAAMHYLLLLVDMSGSIKESGQLPQLEEAVDLFTSRMGKYQQLAIYGFDGRADIVQIRGFGSGGKASLSGFNTRDPSTNLYGATVKAIDVMQKQIDRSTVPLRFGTLVIFTDGSDQAHRVPRDEVQRQLDQVGFDVYVIGVGGEIDEAELQALGRNGAALSTDPNAVGAEFERVANRIEGYMKRFYLLSYCSPARAGEHELRIEPVAPDGKTGSLTYRFNANGFEPNCDPNKKPNFDLRKPRINAGPGAAAKQ